MLDTAQTLTLLDLRDRLARLNRRERPAWQPLPTGLPVIDVLLPGQGLSRGALHELTGDEAAMIGFLAALLGHARGITQLLWVRADAALYLHGLQQLGLDPSRLTVISTKRRDDRLWAAEEALRALPNGAVILELEQADLTETRRLQLAAEQSGGIGFLIRRDRQPSAAATRWRIEPRPSANGLGPCWRVTLERCRGAKGGNDWDLEWDHATHTLRLAAPLAHGSLAAE